MVRSGVHSSRLALLVSREPLLCPPRAPIAIYVTAIFTGATKKQWQRKEAANMLKMLSFQTEHTIAVYGGNIYLFL